MVLHVRYTVMLDTSQMSGDRRCGCSSTFSARSGRPRSSSTLPTPKNSTRTVITSAMRVIGRRHSAWTSRRIAEMSVPACDTPTKKTKFVM